MQFTNAMISTAVTVAERGFVPDAIIRRGIRLLLQRRSSAAPQTEEDLEAFMLAASDGPIAPFRTWPIGNIMSYRPSSLS